MPHIEEYDDDDDVEQKDDHADDDEDGGADDEQPPNPLGSGAGVPGMHGGFQQLLQLASHLKGAQPEVREKKAKWDRLRWFQKNTVLFQEKDADARYAGGVTSDAAAQAPEDGGVVGSSSPSFARVRFPRASECHSSGRALFQSGAHQAASTAYQRAVGLFQWARKFQTKDGDEIEWYDLLDTKKNQATAAAAAAAAAAATGGSGAANEAMDEVALTKAAAASAPLHIVLPSLTPSQHAQVEQFVFTCLVNVAACEEKLEQWQNVVDVCEAALAMQCSANTTTMTPTTMPAVSTSAPGSTAALPCSTTPLPQLTLKALYRCATAYTHLDELDQAIALLSRASLLAPSDPSVKRTLARLKTERARQAQKDKASFGGLFERGEIFPTSPSGQVKSAFEAPGRTSSDSSAHSSSSSASAAPLGVDGLPRDIPVEAADQTKSFLADYLSGFAQQAEVDRQLKQKKTSGSQGSNEGATVQPPSPLGGHGVASAGSPSPEHLSALYADAKQNFGLDLSDPAIQAELKRLQEEHRRTGRTETEREQARRDQQQQQRPSSRVQKKSPLSSTSTAGGALPSDLDSSSSWLGPLLFVVILALAVKLLGLV